MGKYRISYTLVAEVELDDEPNNTEALELLGDAVADMAYGHATIEALSENVVEPDFERTAACGMCGAENEVTRPHCRYCGW